MQADEDRRRGDEDTIVKTPSEARQGVELHRMRHVLWISVLAAIIIIGALYLYFHAHS